MKFTETIKQVAEELKFWQGFVKTERFLEGWCADIRTPELRDSIYNFVKQHPKAKVLDVGAGACSILNGTVPNALLTASDPLAPLYELIFPYHKYPFSAPKPYAVEDLPYEDTFDIVHISNALDHCQNPEAALQSMFRAAKPGGWVVVCGFENESNAQGHQGMHQWNIELGSDGILEVTHGTTKVVNCAELGTVLERTPFNDRHWMAWAAQKPL